MMGKARALFAACVIMACSALSPAVAQVRIVSEGEIRAVVVTADNPAMVASYAAQELVRHIEKATGKQLRAVTETAIPKGYVSRIFIGMTEAARKQGLVPEKMKPDEFVLRTVGRDLYVLGMEDKSRDVVLGDPADGDWSHKILHDGTWNYRGPSSISPNGTLFGVYEILERYVHARWLWPGDLGTYVPRTGDLLINESLDEYHTPKIPWRRFSWFHLIDAQRYPDSYDPRTERLAFSRQGLRNFWEATGIYLGRHRMGYSTPPPTMREEFAYKPWRRGTPLIQEHPEFYAMGPDGHRFGQPGSKYKHADMCVSNPALHRFILEKVWAGKGTLKLGQCNTIEYCRCAKCLAWDGPQPGDIPGFASNTFGPRAISDRYAQFWKTVHEVAAKRTPGVRTTCLMYQTTLPAPLREIKLSENIYGEYCPWSGAGVMFPMPEAVDQWSRQQWLGWRKTGMSMIWRPNHLHGGYTMPYLSTRQVGEFFKFAYKNGLAGYYFDSLRVDWATQGPMIYIHMALGWDPELDIEELRKDFWSAFGPAAGQVEQ